MKRSIQIITATLMIFAFTGVGMAETVKPSTEQMVSFKKKVKERDSLVQKLGTLDRAAADALKRGEKPVRVYADQASVQNRLDLLELQIDLFAARFDMDVPARPSSKRDEAKGSTKTVKTDRAFVLGQRRAVKQLSDDCQQMMASIDFSAFLSY